MCLFVYLIQPYLTSLIHETFLFLIFYKILKLCLTNSRWHYEVFYIYTLFSEYLERFTPETKV